MTPTVPRLITPLIDRFRLYFVEGEPVLTRGNLAAWERLQGGE